LLQRHPLLCVRVSASSSHVALRLETTTREGQRIGEPDQAREHKEDKRETGQERTINSLYPLHQQRFDLQQLWKYHG